MCTQVIRTNKMDLINSPFLICDQCNYACIGEYMFTEFWKDSNIINSYWFYYERKGVMCYTKTHKMIFNNNSHKLVHRYYHTVMIIFLMARLDNSSYCCDLILDVIMYMLKFIY